MTFSGHSIVMISLASLLIFSCPALADSIKEKLSTLQILPLKFGVNEFTVNGSKVIIVKGAHIVDAGGSRDTYATLIENKYPDAITGENPFWQSVPFDESPYNLMLQETNPHTYEDALASIRFMVKKNEAHSKEFSSLYVFRSNRDFPGVLTDPSFTKLSLYVFHPAPKANGPLYFEPVGTMKTKKKYGSADCAAYIELNVKLPSYTTKDNCPQTNDSAQ